MEDIHDEVANLRTNLSSLQSVTNSLGTYSLISLSRYCSSNFCRSSESTEHLLKVDLKVLPANDNPQTASSWSVIRASLLVETYIYLLQSIDIPLHSCNFLLHSSSKMHRYSPVAFIFVEVWHCSIKHAIKSCRCLIEV